MEGVYVVSSGDYSDYTVNGIFSTKKKAEKYIDMCVASSACYLDKQDFHDICKWGIDEGLKREDHTRYECWIYVDSGEIDRENFHTTFDIRKNRIFHAREVPAYDKRVMIPVESVKSAEHAKKLAVEARQKYLREKA